MRKWVDYAGWHIPDILNRPHLGMPLQSLPYSTGKFIPADLKSLLREGIEIGHVWPPKQDRGEPRPRNIEDHPIIKIIYEIYLERRGRMKRQGEAFGEAMLPIDIASILQQYGGVHGNWSVDLMVEEILLSDSARYQIRVKSIEGEK